MPPKDPIECIDTDKGSSQPSSVVLIASSPSQGIDTAFGSQLTPVEDTESSRESPSLESPALDHNKQSPVRPLMKNTLFGFEMPFDAISVAYAATVAIGGIIGYAKAKSTYSLAAGLLFGGILGFGAYQTSVNPRNYHLSLATSAVLGAFMGYRAFNSGKFMPAGLVATLSILMVMRFSYRAFTESGYMIRK